MIELFFRRNTSKSVAFKWVVVRYHQNAPVYADGAGSFIRVQGIALLATALPLGLLSDRVFLFRLRHAPSSSAD